MATKGREARRRKHLSEKKMTINIKKLVKHKLSPDSTNDVKAPKFSPYLLMSTLSVNFLTLALGIGTVSTSPLVPKYQSNGPENPLDHKMTQSELSWYTALSIAGNVLTPFIAGRACDKFGRKPVVLIGSLPLLVYFFMTAFGNHIAILYISRIMIGFTSGFVFTILPMYNSELADKTNRGTYGCFISISYYLGTIFSYSMGSYLSIRVFSLVSIIPQCIFFVLFPIFGIESPIYLVRKGDTKTAERNLCKLRMRSTNTEELLEINEYVGNSKENNTGGLKDLVATKGLTIVLLITMFLMMLPQLSGFWVVLGLMQTIFIASGSSIPSDISSVIVGVLRLVCIFITFIFVEKLGRKTLLLISTTGSMLCLIVLGAYFYLKEHNFDTSTLFWLPLTFFALFELVFTLGMSNIPTLYMCEIYPANLKTIAITVGQIFNSVVGFLISFYFPKMYVTLGYGYTFWMFAIFCSVSAGIIFFVIKETKGKSFAEIQLMLKLYEK